MGLISIHALPHTSCGRHVYKSRIIANCKGKYLLLSWLGFRALEAPFSRTVARGFRSLRDGMGDDDASGNGTLGTITVLGLLGFLEYESFILEADSSVHCYGRNAPVPV